MRVCTCKQDSFGGVCSWLYSVAVAGAVVMMAAAAVMMGAAVVMMGAAAVMMGAAVGGRTVPRAMCPACLLVGASMRSMSDVPVTSFLPLSALAWLREATGSWGSVRDPAHVTTPRGRSV